MNILVLGGSYFLGKCFVNMALKEHSVTVFNRGNRPLKLPSVHEIFGDRHDTEALEVLNGTHYDAVVDFCAYNPEDISLIFKGLRADFDQYIFISTCDVYERGLNKLLDEDAPFEYRNFPGQAGGYISGKVALEKELRDYAVKYGVSYTSIRPSFIYGPYNYAPRESMYFNWIKKAGQILHPTDASGEFQLVYVDDVALAVLKSIGNRDAFNQAYNLAPIQLENYDSFYEALANSVSTKIEKVPVTVQIVNEKNIPLPFPLTGEESNRYDGNKALGLIKRYTGLAEGLKKTYDLFFA